MLNKSYKLYIGLALFSLALCCLVTLPVFFSSEARPREAITYAKQVAPILQKRCEECHHAGGIAPMQFTTYDAARPWAKAIKDKVVSRQMPPFHATGDRKSVV